MHLKILENVRGERFHLRCRPHDTGTKFLLCVCAVFLVLMPIGAVHRFQRGLSGEGWKILAAYPLVIGIAVLAGCVYWFGCLMLPPIDAGLMCGNALLGLFPVVAMFVHRLRSY